MKSERTAFATLMAGLATMRRRDDLSEMDVTIYEAGTHDIPIDLLSAAASRILITEQWCPTVADLRRVSEQLRQEHRKALAYDGCAECTRGWKQRDDRTVERCRCWQAYQTRLESLGLTGAPLAQLTEGSDAHE